MGPWLRCGVSADVACKGAGVVRRECGELLNL